MRAYEARERCGILDHRFRRIQHSWKQTETEGEGERGGGDGACVWFTVTSKYSLWRADREILHPVCRALRLPAGAKVFSESSCAVYHQR